MSKKYHVSTKTDLEKPNIFSRIRNKISTLFIRAKKITPEDKESTLKNITTIREKDNEIFKYNFRENIVGALENQINCMDIANHDFLRDNWMQSNYYLLESIGMKDKADELRKVESDRKEKNKEKNNNFKENLKVNEVGMLHKKGKNGNNEIQDEIIKNNLDQEDTSR